MNLANFAISAELLALQNKIMKFILIMFLSVASLHAFADEPEIQPGNRAELTGPGGKKVVASVQPTGRYGNNGVEIMQVSIGPKTSASAPDAYTFEAESGREQKGYDRFLAKYGDASPNTEGNDGPTDDNDGPYDGGVDGE